MTISAPLLRTPKKAKRSKMDAEPLSKPLGKEKKPLFQALSWKDWILIASGVLLLVALFMPNLYSFTQTVETTAEDGTVSTSTDVFSNAFSFIFQGIAIRNGRTRIRYGQGPRQLLIGYLVLLIGFILELGYWTLRVLSEKKHNRTFDYWSHWAGIFGDLFAILGGALILFGKESVVKVACRSTSISDIWAMEAALMLGPGVILPGVLGLLGGVLSFSFHEKKWKKEIKVDLSPAHDGSNVKTIEKNRPALPYVLFILIAVILICIALLPEGDHRGWNWQAWGESMSMLFYSPNFEEKYATGYWPFLWKELSTYVWSTIEICFIGTLLGALVSIPIYYACSRNVVKKKSVYMTNRVIQDFIRTIPQLIIGLLFSDIFGTGTAIAGILTVAVFTTGIMYEMMYEYIETLDMSPFEAIRSTGGNNVQCVNVGLHPEVQPMFFAYFIYTFEINIRASVIFAYCGLGGYGKQLIDFINQGYYDKAGALLWPLLIIVMILQFISNQMARRLR